MNSFNKYIWLLNTLRRYKYGASLEQLRREWYDSDLNADHSELNARTFSRWKNAIEDLFELSIECNAADGYKYYIADDTNLEENRVISWLLHTMTVANVIEEYKGERENIILEDVPSGEKYLMNILEAIKRKRQMKLVYHRFQEKEAQKEELVNPLCVRLFEKRWYAVVDYASRADTTRRIIALDRIEELEVTDTCFDWPEGFKGKDYFADDYGISVGFGSYVPCRVVLKVDVDQTLYIRTLPLHATQRELETVEGYTLFEYHLRPTPEFARAILPWGKHIEVLEPFELRKMVVKMGREVVKNNELYRTK